MWDTYRDAMLRRELAEEDAKVDDSVRAPQLQFKLIEPSKPKLIVNGVLQSWSNVILNSVYEYQPFAGKLSMWRQDHRAGARYFREVDLDNLYNRLSLRGITNPKKFMEVIEKYGGRISGSFVLQYLYNIPPVNDAGTPIQLDPSSIWYKSDLDVYLPQYYNEGKSVGHTVNDSKVMYELYDYMDTITNSPFGKIEVPGASENKPKKFNDYLGWRDFWRHTVVKLGRGTFKVCEVENLHGKIQLVHVRNCHTEYDKKYLHKTAGDRFNLRYAAGPASLFFFNCEDDTQPVTTFINNTSDLDFGMVVMSTDHINMHYPAAVFSKSTSSKFGIPLQCLLLNVIQQWVRDVSESDPMPSHYEKVTKRLCNIFNMRSDRLTKYIDRGFKIGYPKESESLIKQLIEITNNKDIIGAIERYLSLCTPE